MQEIVDVINIFRKTVDNQDRICQSIWSLDSIIINGNRWIVSLHTSPVTWKRFFFKEETCILYQNMHRKRTLFKDNRSSTITKLELHPKKVLLSIWWDWKDIVYYKLLSQGNETINFGKYCNQLDKLKHTIAGKWSKLVNRQGHYNKTACCIDCKRKAVTI